MIKPVARFLSLPSLIMAATPLHGEEPPRLTVFVVGDSTMADYPLKTLSMELYTQLGPQRSAKLFSNPEPGEYPEYKPPGAKAPGAPSPFEDNTHFNALGACRMADLAAAELRAKVPALAKWLRK